MSCQGTNPSKDVFLSSGNILFADPTQGWSPDQFPQLPNPLVTMTAHGTVADRNLSTLSFSNNLLYEDFEPIEQYPNLVKTLQINESGNICYTETKVGFVSTTSVPFSAPISSFTTPVIGGVGIKDITSGTPDTITNALGKLDAWITNAFLIQPPAVSTIYHEDSSLYGGVQWLNFETWLILDKFVPFVTGIVFILGDPTDSFCSFEFFDRSYFPYRNFRDGISPHFSPLVRFRAFTDFFCIPNATHFFSKKGMQEKCVRIIDASGYEFPESGYVMALENTDGYSTVTTMSVYIPGLPKDTDIPLNIIYLNHTQQSTNVCATTIRITTGGSPSAPFAVSPYTSTPTSITVEVEKPTFSDATANISTPYFSTYITNYTFNSFHQECGGFRYGIPTTTTVPDYVSTYISTFSTQSRYVSSVQTIQVTGLATAPIIPGVVWSTTVRAVNDIGNVGQEAPGLLIASDFPASTAPNISSVGIAVSTLNQANYASASTMRYINAYNNGWTVGPFVPRDVVFMSTVSPVNFQVLQPVQFNAFPGDRGNIVVKSFYTDESANTTSLQLTLSSVANDFPLNVPRSFHDINNNTILTTLTDSYTLSTFQKYSYKALIADIQNIQTISASPKSLFFTLQNNTCAGIQTFSTPTYNFQTEMIGNDALTSTIRFNNYITSTTQVSGIFTPTTSSLVYFDILGSNFAYTLVSSCFATAQLNLATTGISPLTKYSQNVYIYDGPTNIISLPFTQNRILSISSCTLPVNNNVYQLPYNATNNPKPVNIAVQLPSLAPQTSHSTCIFTVANQLFIDTVSLNTVSTFTKTTSANGLRVASLLPVPYSQLNTVAENNIQDSVDSDGQAGLGLDTITDPYFAVNGSYNFDISSSIVYSHTSSISSIWTDYYSRELLYTRSKYMHPGGQNFNLYSGVPLGQPSAIYPNFTYDLVYDVNNGFRYASFAYESPVALDPVPYQYAYIRIVNPSLVSSITDTISKNKFWPDFAVPSYYVENLNVRLHLKTLGSHNCGMNEPFESAWINGLKSVNECMFDDTMFDEGACIRADISGNAVTYKVQLRRRYYTKLCAIVRVGLTQKASIYCGNPVTFDAVNISYSDT